MRSFEGQLTERQLADVIAYLRTWQNEDADEAKPE